MLGRIKESFTVAGVSAGFMYLFDPDLGKRRRSLLRDKFTHARNQARKAADVAIRDAEHRIYGTYCELRAKLRGRDTSDDVVLAPRSLEIRTLYIAPIFNRSSCPQRLRYLVRTYSGL